MDCPYRSGWGRDPSNGADFSQAVDRFPGRSYRLLDGAGGPRHFPRHARTCSTAVRSRLRDGPRAPSSFRPEPARRVGEAEKSPPTGTRFLRSLRSVEMTVGGRRVSKGAYKERLTGGRPTGVPGSAGGYPARTGPFLPVMVVYGRPRWCKGFFRTVWRMRLGAVVYPASVCGGGHAPRACMEYAGRVQIGEACSAALRPCLVFPTPSHRPFARTRSSRWPQLRRRPALRRAQAVFGAGAR